MDTNTVNISTKEELQSIRILKNACSTDSARPVLTGIHVENGHCRAVDGFILMQLETPDCLQDHQSKTVRFLQTPRMGLNEVEYMEGDYPDTDALTSHLEYKKTFSVNASYLQQLIKSLPKDTCITFELTDDPANKPIVITSEDRKSLIMPMHLPD